MTCQLAIRKLCLFALTEGWEADDFPEESESEKPKSCLVKSIEPSPEISFSSIDICRGRAFSSMLSIDRLLPALRGLLTALLVLFSKAFASVPSLLPPLLCGGVLCWQPNQNRRKTSWYILILLNSTEDNKYGLLFQNFLAN